MVYKVGYLVKVLGPFGLLKYENNLNDKWCNSRWCTKKGSFLEGESLDA